MKNNYGKLTKKKAIELLYKYDTELEFSNHRILDVEILRFKNEDDCAQIIVKSSRGVIYKYFISCFAISVEEFIGTNMKFLTIKNVFNESEENKNE